MLKIEVGTAGSTASVPSTATGPGSNSNSFDFYGYNIPPYAYFPRLKIYSQDAATTTDSGALIIEGTGGAGIGGDLYVGGTIYQNGWPVSTGTGGGTNLSIQDEGVTLTNTTTVINFVGAGVTATNVGNAITVTISGG